MKLRLLLSLALTTLVAEAALACSCLPQTLQERFDAADSIAVVRVTGCASGRADSRGACPDSRWAYEIEDVLKGSPKAGAFGGITSCDLTSKPGAKHLLFLDKAGNVGVCTSRTLDGPGAAFGMQDVALLREYRDGLAVDLSEPWTFRDTGQACTIEHAFGRAAIQFVHQYARGSDAAVDGGGIPLGQPTLVVWHTPVSGLTPTRLSVAGEQYRLAPHAVQRPANTRLDPMYSASSLVQGGSTLGLLEKMKAMPVDVVVYGDRTGSAQAAGARSFRAETRTARLPGAAERFRDCVESKSRGAP